MKYALSLLVFVASVASANAAVTPATWSAWTATTATGDLNGITINVTTTVTAPITGIATDQFGSQWDGAMPLGSSAQGLTVTYVNGGDSQTFSFSSPLLDGTVMYIENFDSSSIAGINFVGATGTTLIDASPSITFDVVGAEDGSLTTSNTGFNGEGDAAIRLSGAVSEITVDYSNGVGANGVFYTFATPDANAVPEPTSAIIIAGLFGLGGLFLGVKKRRIQA